MSVTRTCSKVKQPAVNDAARSHRMALALVALASAVLAALGFAGSQALEVFAPCRSLFGARQAVQGSLACQMYSAINLLAVLFVLAAVVLAVVVVVRRGAPPSNAIRKPLGKK